MMKLCVKANNLQTYIYQTYDFLFLTILINNSYFDFDLVTEFAYSADSVYKKAKTLYIKIDKMLECTKFEIEDTANK